MQARRSRRILAALLAVAMVMAALPSASRADDERPDLMIEIVGFANPNDPARA